MKQGNGDPYYDSSRGRPDRSTEFSTLNSMSMQARARPRRRSGLLGNLFWVAVVLVVVFLVIKRLL